MGYRPRNHQQQIVGWWLGVEYSKLTNEQSEVETQFSELVGIFKRAVEANLLPELLPEKSFVEEKERQLLRIRKVMSGISVAQIAEQEYVRQPVVVASVRYMLARLAIIAEREAYE